MRSSSSYFIIVALTALILGGCQKKEFTEENSGKWLFNTDYPGGEAFVVCSMGDTTSTDSLPATASSGDIVFEEDGSVACSQNLFSDDPDDINENRKYSYGTEENNLILYQELDGFVLQFEFEFLENDGPDVKRYCLRQFGIEGACFQVYPDNDFTLTLEKRP